MEDGLAFNEYRDLLVKKSWRRCENEFKLDPSSITKVDVLTQSEIRDRQNSLAHYLSTSNEVIQAVRGLARQGNYCVIISDGAGVAVDEYSDTAESIECRDHGIRLGSIWGEKFVGTNGIGTCLNSNYSVSVNGHEHYAELFNKCTCTAAPIHSVNGNAIGALNISRIINDNFAESFFTHNFISQAAKQISANIFLAEFKHFNIISCMPYSNISLYEPKALIAFDDTGVIQGATLECMELLDNIDLDEIINQNISDLLPVPVEKIFSFKDRHIKIKEGLFANNYIKGLKISSDIQAHYTPSAQPIVLPKKQIIYPQKTDKLNQFAGDDQTVQRAVEIGKKLIDKDIPILILGETGVGKDTLAKLLHEQSLRSEHPFISVNCAAIPPTLMESELFGYKPGTFTDGLKEGKKGKILASHGGTLFLDEIGDMPLNLQAHLLHVLEEREVTPLGAIEPVPVDIRIICATHKNIDELIANGLFRQDLLFRIQGAEIELPPLRARSNIKHIAQQIIKSESQDNTEYKITNEVWQVLETHLWPGNIRELKSALKYALCFCKDNVITLNDLPDKLNGLTQKHITAGAQQLLPSSQTLQTNKMLSLQEEGFAAESQMITNLLKQNHWNITTTAEKLGVSRSTLHRKIKKYNILSPNKMND